MALQCQLSANYASYTAGQSPAPMVTLQVYNPGAAAVVVTGIALKPYALGDPNKNRLAMAQVSPPIGQGQTVIVPALSSINIGPFPVAIGSAANVNAFQMVQMSGSLSPVNPQPSQPANMTVMVGADVYGSDGSVNQAGEVAILVSGSIQPPPGFQGGVLQFSAPNNAVDYFMGVL